MGEMIFSVAGIASLCALVSLGAALSVLPWLTRLSPDAQARVLLSAALAPAFAAFLVPFALVVDLVFHGCHAHGCLGVVRDTSPPVAVMLLASLFAGRFAVRTARTGRALLRGWVLEHALARASERTAGDWRLLAARDPQAFVVGTLRPRIYLSQGLLASADAEDVSVVLEHERAHARRRDPLRRALASLGLAFHLPGVASRLERALARAHELAADAHAAQRAGDRSRIAQVLVRCARLRVAGPSPSAALFGSDLESRVRALLASEPDAEGPPPAALAAAAVVALLFAAFASHALHNGVEVLVLALVH